MGRHPGEQGTRPFTAKRALSQAARGAQCSQAKLYECHRGSRRHRDRTEQVFYKALPIIKQWRHETAVRLLIARQQPGSRFEGTFDYDSRAVIQRMRQLEFGEDPFQAKILEWKRAEKW